MLFPSGLARRVLGDAEGSTGAGKRFQIGKALAAEVDVASLEIFCAENRIAGYAELKENDNEEVFTCIVCDDSCHGRNVS